LISNRPGAPREIHINVGGETREKHE